MICKWNELPERSSTVAQSEGTLCSTRKFFIYKTGDACFSLNSARCGTAWSRDTAKRGDGLVAILITHVRNGCLV